jgi:hypothetical protein
LQELGQELGLSQNRQDVVEKIAASAKNQEATVKKQDKQREAAGGSTKICIECGKIGREAKRCTGCYLEIYCSAACQRAAWPGHKHACRQVREQFRPVVITPDEEAKAQLLALKKSIQGAKYAKPNEPMSMFAVRVDVSILEALCSSLPRTAASMGSWSGARASSTSTTS